MKPDYKIEFLDEHQNKTGLWRLVNIEADKTKKKRLISNMMKEERLIGLIEFLTKGSVIENSEERIHGILIYSRD